MLTQKLQRVNRWLARIIREGGHNRFLMYVEQPYYGRKCNLDFHSYRGEFKASKDRLTLLLGANAVSDLKLKPMLTCLCVCSVTKLCPNSVQPHGLKPARLLCPWISQARLLEWAAISFSTGSSWCRDQTHGSCIAGRFFTTEPPGNAYLPFQKSYGP